MKDYDYTTAKGRKEALSDIAERKIKDDKDLAKVSENLVEQAGRDVATDLSSAKVIFPTSTKIAKEILDTKKLYNNKAFINHMKEKIGDSMDFDGTFEGPLKGTISSLYEGA